MRTIDYTFGFCLILAFAFFAFQSLKVVPVVEAQVAPTTLTFHAVSDHTKCSLAQTPQLDGRGPGACIAIDGVWVQGSNDTAPWQLTKPIGNVPAVVSINNRLPDNGGNITLKISDLPGILQASQDMSTRSCPILAMTVGSTGDTLKFGPCGN